MRRPANQPDILIENEIRQRRPIIRQHSFLDNSEPDDETKTVREESEGGASGHMWIRRHLNSVRRTFTVRLFET